MAAVHHPGHPSGHPSGLSRSTISLSSTAAQTVTTNEKDREAEQLSDAPDAEKLAPVPRSPAGSENELFKPKTVKFWLILVANFLALFLVALARALVATAVPRITDEFHSLGDIGWYASAYML